MAERRAAKPATTEDAEVRTPPYAAKGAPRFGMCQGTREELERTGTAIDPFTGETLTRDDLP